MAFTHSINRSELEIVLQHPSEPYAQIIINKSKKNFSFTVFDEFGDVEGYDGSDSSAVLRNLRSTLKNFLSSPTISKSSLDSIILLCRNFLS